MGIPFEELSGHKAHLRMFYDRLAARSEVRQGRHPWYALSRYGADYADEFKKPKIIYPDIAKRCEFSFEEIGYYIGNTTYFIPEGSLYLLAVLNTRVTEFFYGQISAAIRGGFVRFFSQYLAKVPIPDAPPAERAAIEKLVGRLLALRGQGPEVAGQS